MRLASRGWATAGAEAWIFRVNRRRLLPAVAVLVGLAAALTGQSASEIKAFDNSRPPGGVVLDGAGKPVAGADVFFRVEPLPVTGMEWRDTILRRQPLPRVRTGKDGEFFVPLTGLHRLCGGTTGGAICLVVEKDGFHPWVEPLADGLRGYLGSRVVLRPITPAEQFEVRVVHPRPGMLVRVHRFSTGRQAGIDVDRWFPVPASGVLVAAMDFLPSPLISGVRNNLTTPIGIDVQLVYPGATTKPFPLRFGQRKLEFGASDARGKFVGVLRRRDGGKLIAPRGLYRCPDGNPRWFPVDPENVEESSRLPLIAVHAEGCLAVDVRYSDPEKEAIELEAVDPTAARSMELLDASGKPIANAQVSFFDLHRLPAHSARNRMGSDRARRRLQVENGRVELSGLGSLGPGFLWIEAPGFKPVVRFEPCQIRGVDRLSLGSRSSRGTLVLTLVDPEGKPASGVYVALGGNSSELGVLNGELPRSDASGKVEIGNLPPGNHTLRLVGEGWTEGTSMVRIRGSGTQNQKVVLKRTRKYRLLLVDDKGEPQPFRPVRTYAQAQAVRRLGGVQVQSRSSLVAASDSLGRVLISDLPADSGFRVTDLISGLIQAPAQAVLDETEPVSRMVVTGLDTVWMPLPEAAVMKESLLSSRGTSNRNLVAPAGCGVVIVRFPKPTTELVLSIFLKGVPPLRVTEELVAAARARQGEGVLFVDQRQLNRDVKLAFEGLGALPVEDFRIEVPGMNFARDQAYLYGNSGLTVDKLTGGALGVKLRDEGAYRLWVLHPEFRPQCLDVPAVGTGSVKPLPVVLQRGTALVFHIRSVVRLQPNFQVQLRINSSTNQLVLYEREAFGETNHRSLGDGWWELRTPFALAPGQYQISLRIQGSQVNLPRQAFKVSEKSPLVIKVEKKSGKIHKAGRIPAQERKVKSLEQEVAALRAKGKAAPAAPLLKQLEAQLAREKAVLSAMRAMEASRQPKVPDPIRRRSK